MEKKKYFPIFIDLSEKKIVVIGGGTIAGRRINTLCHFCDHVLVVAPEVTPVVKELVQQEKVTWIRATYDRSYLTDANLVVAATDHTQVNHQVKADCLELEKEQNRQIFVSVADDKSLCDFYFPSIVQDEEMVIGINSGGAPPRLPRTAPWSRLNEPDADDTPHHARRLRRRVGLRAVPDGQQ